MKKIIFISGNPGHGKSFLANKLQKEYCYSNLSLDMVYVDYVKKHVNMLFFPDLRKYIAPHYNCILRAQEYSIKTYGRDFIREWHDFLLRFIKENIQSTDKLVVEGYLLYDCLDELSPALSAIAQVIKVNVMNHKYYIGEKLVEISEIDKL